MDVRAFKRGLKGVGDVIAARLYDLELPDGSHREVTVLVGKPQPLPDDGDFYCPYQIRGLRESAVSCAFGVDTLQTVVLAMQMIAIELYSSKEGTLTWLEQTDLGFPVPDALRGD